MTSILKTHYLKLRQNNTLPKNHVDHLWSLKKEGFEPKIIYDIGSSTLHWTDHVKKIWPDGEIILFDANSHCEFLYTGFRYHIGLLSDTNHAKKKFYLNEYSPGGASYYREIGDPMSAMLYPVDRYYNLVTTTLDEIVAQKNFPLPDLIKMDIQGAEHDVIQGGTKTLQNAQHLIVELPKDSVQYNENAPNAQKTTSLLNSLGWKCVTPLFSDNGADGDYDFIKMQ